MPVQDDEQDLRGLVDAALGVRLRGWDFSFLAGRTVTEPLPWDYPGLARDAARRSVRLLDVDTGGGEVLTSIGPPAGSIAVEPYVPNVAVATATLAPLGVEVRRRVDDHLPVADREVDLVLNRHAAFDAAEVFRVLQPGGRLVSQQVARHNDAELNGALGVPLHEPTAFDSVGAAEASLREAGLEVVRCEEAWPRTDYLDVGAVVLQLRAVPWQVPGFDPRTHLDRLRDLHHHIGRHGSFTVTSHRLLLVARRP